MNIKYVLIYLKKRVFVGFLIGILIPITIYKASIVVFPEPDPNNFVEFRNMEQISKKLKKLKKQKKHLRQLQIETKYTTPHSATNIDVVRLELDMKKIKEEIQNLKQAYIKNLNELNNQIYNQSPAWYRTIVFYCALLIAVLTAFFGTSLHLIPIALGFLFGGLYCLFMMHYTYLQKLTNFTKFSALIALLALLLIFFAIDKNKTQNQDL